MIKKNPAMWLALLITLIFLLLARFPIDFLESLELKTYDLRMRFRAGNETTKTDIVVVEIDDDSITKLGRWPWPRSLVAQMVTKLKEQKASLIGLNIIFSEPEVAEGLNLIRELEADFSAKFARSDNEEAKDFLSKLTKAQATLDRDKILAQAIADSGNVVLPVFFEIGPYIINPDKELDFEEVLLKNGLIHAQGMGQGYIIPASKVIAPISSFAEGATGLGHVNTLPDRDGAVRREALLIDFKGLPFPSYTLKMAMLSRGLQMENVHIQGMEGLKFGPGFIPTNPNLDFFVTFTDPKAFPRFSFYDVLNDKVDPAAFKDKIVLIGVSATGIDIPQVTPIDKTMSTGMFSANVLHNLIKGGFIVRSGMMNLVEFLVILLVGLFLSILLPRLRARSGAIVSGVVLVGIVGAGIYLFVGMDIWFKITYPVLLAIFGYAAVTTTRYFVTEARKEKVEGESVEINRMLGLNFQSQGQLDLAFDKFRRCPVDDGLKDILYNLALDFERKRMLNKAVSVYQYIGQHDSDYRDITAKIKKLNVVSETMIFGLGTGGRQADDGTLVIDEDTKPTLGRYEIIKVLGKGAMGVVYQGKDPKINRVTAIKTIRFEEEYEPEEVDKIKKQFFIEAETAGILSHPNIVTIYDAGEDLDLSYIAMEYLEGHDLKEHTKVENLLPMRQVIGIVADVADALNYAHDKGIVHRDIKPANIMLLDNGEVKVTDFGIARATATSKTKTGVVKGTPFYMSPEQIKGVKVDGRSDIFSLGVLLYELLAGVQPFRADDLTSLIFKITTEEPEPVTEHNPKVPKAVVQIISKALMKEREKRYPKADQMASHLRMVARKLDELAAKKQ
ncbi:MAG: CHASE2 domain-containing protein [Deltaproteobacteria bacterium]|nr:CHASE2 domain-containing protein [Deltaproteobacteria bacterium]MBW2052308.1 CHASE2 domain-containing protein [Deltaproteobacteria bacterium]